MQAIFDELKSIPFESIDAANEWLSRRAAAYNDAPQADFGGLSPTQMSALLVTEWGHDSVSQVATNLALSDVANSAWYLGARALLAHLDACGGYAEQSRGVLGDGALEAMATVVANAVGDRGLHRLGLIAGPPDVDDITFSEVFGLLFAAGHLHKTKKRLVVRQASRRLLADDQAGALYRSLLVTYLRDLRLCEQMEAPPAFEPIEHGLPFTIFRLHGETAGKWRAPTWLWKRVLHPNTIELFRSLSQLPVEARAVPLAVLVLQPLVQLDLLEGRVRAGAREPEFRQTPLFGRAITFNWSAKHPVTPPPRKR